MSEHCRQIHERGGQVSMIVASCGHSVPFEFREADQWHKQRLEKALRKKCPACIALDVEALKAAEAEEKAKRFRFSYQQIHDLHSVELNRAVAVAILDREFVQGREKAQPATSWKGFAKLLSWFEDQGWVYRMGNYPERPGLEARYFSVQVHGEWLGMQGKSILIAACRAALMVYCCAWPPGSMAAQVEGPES